MKLADLSLAGIAVELDQDGNLLIEAPQGALTPELISRIREAKPRLVAELRAGREHCELGELQGDLGGLETESVTPTFKVHAPPPQTPEALRTALAEAGKGLPVTVAELVREFGAEGREGWEAGDYAHPAFLRAFAVAVSERLQRERQAEASRQKAGPSSLDEFPLIPADQWLLGKDSKRYPPMPKSTPPQGQQPTEKAEQSGEPP